MSLSTWVREQIEARARHHRLVWVHDPYALLEAAEIPVLQQDLKSTGHSLLAVKNALQLREGLEGRDPLTAKMVLLDQSYTLRDAHLLPKDAQPADLLPLRAPDWKPLVAAAGIFQSRPCVGSSATSPVTSNGPPRSTSIRMRNWHATIRIVSPKPTIHFAVLGTRLAMTISSSSAQVRSSAPTCLRSVSR